jgi:hypothetical protein
MIFTGSQPNGTVPVRNCEGTLVSYVTIGANCTGATTLLGYVSKSPAAGYEQLKQIGLGISGCATVPSAYVPLGSGSTGSGISASTFYTVPIGP